MPSGSQRDFGHIAAMTKQMTKGCCVPDATRRGGVAPDLVHAGEPDRARTEAVPLPGGKAEVGTDAPVFPQDGEAPRRFVPIKPFAIDAVAVTNARFAAFVASTGYVTEAERFGWSFVFSGDMSENAGRAPRVVGTEWWCRSEGACWRHPEGQGSEINTRLDHPVVHVSLRDAEAFAAWAGGRLPSEAEWEHAARGGKSNAVFPWGNMEPSDEGPYPCNIWQGRFPHHNTAADGYRSTAPARSFEPNGYGLFQMCGNVWEWTSTPFRLRSLRRSARELTKVATHEGRRVLKGGSYLCHRSYCFRYRIAARIGNAADTSTGHIGFRVVYDAT
jgi:formylglycine-generating enzyme required for sulfatase activity